MSGKSKVAEVTSARIRFGVTLQSLVDKKGDGNISSDEDDGSTQAEMLQSEPAIILSPTKRSTAKISRKRKRKDDDSMDGSQYHHTYVMKLFDRSVDLAQFDEEAALYPVCRAWLKNQPHNRSLGTRERTPTPEPEPPTNSEEEEDIFPDVFKLPDPIKADPDIQQDYRIPMPVTQPEEELDINADQDTAPPPEHLLLGHMERWKMVRQSWRDAGFMNELRFSDSMNVLGEMFDQQMKESP
ncbi:protein lin-37 homolog isoform X2 [Ylistrum balloti]|uniref:protein lin-37 homolog isoform X2 n=1 Tax=Ylistrum balloti TaxID=509963 RepID=UPI002905F0D8|nr:protein lin-37 homolog isoform X2 [Ylistrum balloti]